MKPLTDTYPIVDLEISVLFNCYIYRPYRQVNTWVT